MKKLGSLAMAALALVAGWFILQQLAANGQELVVDGATGRVERLIELARAISPQMCT